MPNYYVLGLAMQYDNASAGAIIDLIQSLVAA
jgi:hypothetical protein